MRSWEFGEHGIASPTQKHPKPFLLYSRGEHCSPALAAPATPKIHPRTVGGPAMQAPTSERQGPHKNTPALAAPTTSKIRPRTVGGPAMQAPTSERRGLRKIISPFCNFIVGASIARPLKPCAAARPIGWSRAPPLQYTARECVKFLSLFRNSTVGAGLGSARVRRTLALAFRPAAYTEHPRPRRTSNPSIHPRTVGGPAMQAPTSKRQAHAKTPPTFPII